MADFAVHGNLAARFRASTGSASSCSTLRRSNPNLTAVVSNGLLLSRVVGGRARRQPQRLAKVQLRRHPNCNVTDVF